MEQEKIVKSRFKSVCVYSGSSFGKKECYAEAALELGQEMVAKSLDLVYGGGSIGLMGRVAQVVHGGGGRVMGFIPALLAGVEKTGEAIGELTVVADMYQRKAEMARHADCFIALPGGYGTLEELLEVMSFAQLGILEKPVGLLNVDGFYNLLIDFIDKAVDEGFIKPSQRNLFVSAPNAKELIHKLEEYVYVLDEDFAKLHKVKEVEVESKGADEDEEMGQIGSDVAVGSKMGTLAHESG